MYALAAPKAAQISSVSHVGYLDMRGLEYNVDLVILCFSSLNIVGKPCDAADCLSRYADQLAGTMHPDIRRACKIALVRMYQTTH